MADKENQVENENTNQAETPKQDLNPFPNPHPRAGDPINKDLPEGYEEGERPEVNASDYERYEDLSNSDLSDVLGDHRLTRVYRNQNRFQGLNMPLETDSLLGLVRARLIGKEAPLEPSEPPVDDNDERMTKDAAIAQLKGISTFDQLLQAYKDLLVEKAPLVDDQDGTAEFTDLRSRVITDIETTNNEGKPTEQEISDALVSRYNAVNDLTGLEAELSAEQADPVKESVTEMVARIRENEKPAEEAPAT